MPVSSISLFNNIGFEGKVLPDYCILFWHRINNWDDINIATHGADPSSGNSSRIFRQYELGVSANPDVGTSPSTNYVVRCVSVDMNWPLLCDVRYGANTNIPNSWSGTTGIGGAHNYSLPLRNLPPLPSDYKRLSTTKLGIPLIDICTGNHGGHTHTITGLYKGLFENTPSDIKTNTAIDGSNVLTPKSFGTFLVDPIIKDPQLNKTVIKKIPKDIIVLYYGNDGLPEGLYDPFDESIDGATTQNDVSAFGFSLPITFVKTNQTLEPDKTGAKNLYAFNETDYYVERYANTISIQTTTGLGGYHDHKVYNENRLTSSIYTGFNYRVIPESKGNSLDFTPDGDFPTGPDPITHTHKVNIKTELKLKSNKLKAYLSINPDAPIVNGLIIGYSIGKYSKFKGADDSGKNTLPQGWYFCDGTNGTPDLRGRYPFLNFTQNDVTNGIGENTISSITLKSINVETIDWKHGHIYQIPNDGKGNGSGKSDVGGHTSAYDPNASELNTTRHNHTNTTYNGVSAINTSFNYEPPTVEIAFIMYNGG
jgi:hypothetical protein